MTLAFTICSVNYLSQARTLGDSLKLQNPEIKFIIGLVDKLESKHLLPEMLPEYDMLPVDKIGINNFKEICDRYNITELNTAVKPYFFDYFLKTNDFENIIYFDPDIIVFKPISRLLNSLKSHDFVLTPHTNSIYNDNKWQTEEDISNAGIYNLGFIALKKSKNAIEFINWWMQKLEKECLIDLCNGLFVDQHWVDFLPIFWNNALIDSYLGYNVAYWNLHERQISNRNGVWFAGEDELVFFHYSGYSPKKPMIVSKYQNRIKFEERADIIPLFKIYFDALIKNGQEYYEPIPCDYIKPFIAERLVRIRNLVKYPLLKMADKL